MVRWIVGSILHGGSIKLFFVPASAPRLVYVMSDYDNKLIGFISFQTKVREEGVVALHSGLEYLPAH